MMGKNSNNKKKKIFYGVSQIHVGGRQRNCDIISHGLIKLRLIILDIEMINIIKKYASSM